jgi:hypothetical protein
MEDLIFQITKIEPHDILNPPNFTAVTVFLSIPSEIPKTSHDVEIRLALPRDDSDTLAILKETARVHTAKVLGELAARVADTDLATLISQSRLPAPPEL